MKGGEAVSPLLGWILLIISCSPFLLPVCAHEDGVSFGEGWES